MKRILQLLLIPVGLMGQSVSITSPTPTQTISGTSYTFASTASSVPGQYARRYKVNGETQCISYAAPYSCTWNSFYSFGGTYNTVVAEVLDALGNVLVTSPAIGFAVNNSLPEPGSVLDWTINPSTSPAATWSSTVSLNPSVTGSAAGGAAHPNAQFFVDGRLLYAYDANAGGNFPSLSISTACCNDGVRNVVVTLQDLSVTLGSSNAGTPWNYQRQWEKQVTFSNGATPMELRLSTYEIPNLCTAAGPNCVTSTAVSGKIYNTDESSSAAVFTSASVADTSIVTASACSPCSLVTLTQQNKVGSTQVTFTESGGKSRTIWVHVNTQNIMPHFGKDGSILTAFNPANSILMTALFQSGSYFGSPYYPAAFSFASDMAASGINTFENGCGFSPALGSLQATWQAGQDAYVSANKANAAAANGYWNCTGDSLMRGTPDVYLTTRGPGASWSPSSTQYLFNSLKNARLLTVNMVDEVQSIWWDKPLQGDLTWGAGLTGLSCVSGANCTVTCSNSAQSGLSLLSGCMVQSGSHRFIITGSGDSNLDYITTGHAQSYVINGSTPGANNTGYASFSFSTPSGVGTHTYTISANPGLLIHWMVDSTFNGTTGAECPPGGGDAGPCTDWIHNNAFSWFMTQANAVSGRPRLAWPVAASYGNVTLQDWIGDPNMADFGMGYYTTAMPGLNYLADKAATNILLSAASDTYRQKYQYLGANRLTPMISGAQGDQINWGFQGNPVSVTSCSGNLITFSVPHGIFNILVWSTRLWVSGSSGGLCDGDYFVLDAPTATTIHVVQAFFPANRSEWDGNATATAQNGDTFTVTRLSGNSGAFNNQAAGPNSAGQNGCNLPNHRGQTFTVHTNSTSNSGPTYDDLTMYLIPAPLGYNNCQNNDNTTWIGQVPTSLSGTGGMAYIVPSQAYERGRTYPTGSDSGPRFAFASAIQPVVEGASGYRIISFGPDNGYLDDPTTHTTAVFGSTSTLDTQGRTHPRLDYGHSVVAWYSHDIAGKLLQRLAPCLLEPRGQAPDLGALFETTIRSSSTYGNCLVAEMFSDGTVTRTIDFSSIAVGGQQTLKYCAGWTGITISTINAGTTSESNTFDPDTCQTVAYVGAPIPATWYSPPTISVRLADVPNASKIVVQWSYSNIGLTAPLITRRTLPQSFDCGSTGTCTLPVDRNIGTIYYKLLYLDASGLVLATSDLQTL